MSYLTAALIEIRAKYAKDKNAKSDKTPAEPTFGTIGTFGADTDLPILSEWDDADWQADYDERAGIIEFEGGLSRADAERLARELISGNLYKSN